MNANAYTTLSIILIKKYKCNKIKHKHKRINKNLKIEQRAKLKKLIFPKKILLLFTR